MNTDIFTGMYLLEAKEALHNEGVTNYRIVVTAPPRQTDREPDDYDRVISVDLKADPPQVLVCKT
ncbi:MAG: hypothetical protein QM315_09890 [Bacillota bacterium]|jgi:hypothetical protein|nr:hypothetical protein [Bacillota bacterium]NLV64223.1 hypothetical protein [Clostridiaceae bacterium]